MWLDEQKGKTALTKTGRREFICPHDGTFSCQSRVKSFNLEWDITEKGKA